MEDAMPQNETKAWMLAWAFFTAMPLVGAGAYRHLAVPAALEEPSSSVMECRDLRPERSRAADGGERGQRRAHARDGGLAVLLLMAQGPRVFALR